MAVNILLNAIQGTNASSTNDDDEEEDGESTASKPPPHIPGTIVRLYGENRHTCGYCHSKENTNVSYGMDAQRLMVGDYELLMNAGTSVAPFHHTFLCDSTGWRRSGTYCYKLLNTETCCPAYTIRLDVEKFHPSQEHRAVLKRM